MRDKLVRDSSELGPFSIRPVLMRMCEVAWVATVASFGTGCVKVVVDAKFEG